jgi:hypothetical protein
MMGRARPELVQVLAKDMSAEDMAKAFDVDIDTLRWFLSAVRTNPKRLQEVLRLYSLHDEVVLDMDEVLDIPGEDLMDWLSRAQSAADDIRWYQRLRPGQIHISHTPGSDANPADFMGLLLAPAGEGVWGINMLLWRELPSDSPFDFLIIEGGDSHKFSSVEKALTDARSLMEWEGDVIGRFIGEQDEVDLEESLSEKVDDRSSRGAQDPYPPAPHYSQEKMNRIKNEVHHPVVVALLDLTAEQPGKPVPYAQALKRAGVSSVSAGNGQLGAFTRYIKRHLKEQRWPFNYVELPNKKGHYQMEEPNATRWKEAK